ncbi:MAG: DUF6057 family protein [Parabacteroides sp.]
MKYIRLIAGIGCFVVTAVFLQITNSFHFYYIEQLQLFRYATDYWVAQMSEVGGAAALLGELLTQYFAYPYVGPVVIAALLTGIFWLTAAILRRMQPKREPWLLALLPALALLLIQFDFNYLLKGTVAFAGMELTLLGWMRLQRPWLRGITALLGVLFLYMTMGPVAGVFAVCMLLIDLFTRRGKLSYLFDLSAIAAFALLAWLAVETTWVRNAAFAWTAQAYYHPILTPKPEIYFAWGCLPLALVLTALWPAKTELSVRCQWIEGVVQWALFAALCYVSIPRYAHREAYPLKQLDYANRQGDWDEVLRLSQGSIQNYLYLNYLNRALAEKGELGDRAFAFNQHGPQGLMVGWDKTFSVSLLLSDVYFTLGEIALSQEMAFEANVSVIGAGSPRCLMRLVQTNLIFGTYPIAEKYIRLLEQTPVYRDWAKQHRAFLYNDAAVEADPLLGLKRRGLPKESDLAGIHGLEHDLLLRTEQQPEHTLPIQYVGVQRLLAKDLQGFQALLDTYYGTPALPTLPVSFQEAVIMLTEKQPERWSYYQVSQSVTNRFSEYRSLVLQNRGNTQLPLLIQRYFGSTYWAYYLLTK